MASSMSATPIASLPVGVATAALSQATGYVFDLSFVEGSPICSYPVSGSWSTLPRIVFYFSMVFALIVPTREWLIGGVLGAAMCYSSLAAIQVIVQVAAHRARGELDLIPIAGILAASCIIAVPLMNWSKTIQRLGLPSREQQLIQQELQRRAYYEANPNEPGSVSTQSTEKPRHLKKKDYGPTRILLVFWSLLVALGFLFVFIGIQSFFSGAPWVAIGVSLNNVTNPSGISCMPSDGVLNMTAGQLYDDAGQPLWPIFRMSREFLTQNNCNDPCGNAITVDTLFRSSSELFALSARSTSYWVEDTLTTSADSLKVHFAEGYFKVMLICLPFVLLQGIMHIALFWRSSPQRARWRIYLWICDIRPESPQPNRRASSLRTRFAFAAALSFYFFALLVLVIAPVAFVLNVFATEFTMHMTRQSEGPDHVDQWGVFAVTILVILAAIICRLDPSRRIVWANTKLLAKLEFRRHQIRHEKRACNDRGCDPVPRIHYNKPTIIGQAKKLYSYVMVGYRQSPNNLHTSLLYVAKDFWNVIHYEWHMFRQFWFCPHIKPQRREKMGEKWYLERPPSHTIESRIEPENYRLRLELDEAKRELEQLRARHGASQRITRPQTPSIDEAESFDIQKSGDRIKVSSMPQLSAPASFSSGTYTKNPTTSPALQMEMEQMPSTAATNTPAQNPTEPAHDVRTVHVRSNTGDNSESAGLLARYESGDQV